jgi:hypothetical protein
MNKKRTQFGSVNAFTRIQAIIIILAVVIASIAGVLYYLNSDSEGVSAPFSIDIISNPLASMKGEKDLPVAMPDQKVLLLVVVEDEGNGDGYGKDVEISSTASDAEVSVSNGAIKPGEVAELIIVPSESCLNKILTIDVEGKRSGITQTKSYDIDVIDWEDDLGETAAEMRDKFIPWLEINYPELGITTYTEWTGTIANPGILVVMHYMFYNDDWEMYITWHVMMPPDDWTRIYLRPRYTETQPTMTFEISSVQGETEPHQIDSSIENR